MKVFGMSSTVICMANTVLSYKVLALLREMSIPPVPCSLLKRGFEYEFTALYVDTVAI